MSTSPVNQVKRRQRKFLPGFSKKLTKKVPKSKCIISSSSSSSEEEKEKEIIISDEESVKNVAAPGSFNWRSYLRKPDFSAAPVSCFKHVALSNCWDRMIVGVVVEVRSPDCKTCCSTTPCSYWIATVVKVCGYWGLLRYEGAEDFYVRYNHLRDKWVNLCTEPHIHSIGWCAKHRKPLVPPKSIEFKIDSWSTHLFKKLVGARTIPANFAFKIEEHMHNTIKKGMKLEVVDKNLISAVRSAEVMEVVGGRLHIKYTETEFQDEGFWCHERSPLIHPVGWAQIIGHDLRAQPDYARQSLKKTLYRTFSDNDATWDMFLPVYNPSKSSAFKNGMKLEAIDPLNLSTICVATVTKVLRNNYLMIGIDGMMAANGSDCFCYHASSPSIFPVGFCSSNGIELTPPRSFKGIFKWNDYLKKTKSEAAPIELFNRPIPNHGFVKGMFLEAVDLMEPRLICVASVTRVVGRLLRVHFEGWDDDYDQWCDCESPDLFPVGWCDVLSYKLEPPRVDATDDKKKKKPIQKRRRRKFRSKKQEEFQPVHKDKILLKESRISQIGSLKLWNLPSDEKTAVEFFQLRNLLPTGKKCKKNHDMVLVFTSDRIFWRCDLRSCREQIGLRKNNWFENSRMSFVNIIRFIYLWSEDLSSISLCLDQLQISNKTVVDWNSYLREICVLDLCRKEKKKIGGCDKVVEIDETLYSKRRNNDEQIFPPVWLFGGICRETKESFLVELPNGNKETLFQEIIDHIHEGSIIFWDSWKTYQSKDLENTEYAYHHVNHAYHFVDPKTGVHTQNIKRFWGSAKWRNKLHRGTARHHLESYLAEFVWKQDQRNKNSDFFEGILEAIVRHFPPA